MLIIEMVDFLNRVMLLLRYRFCLGELSEILYIVFLERCVFI